MSSRIRTLKLSCLSLLALMGASAVALAQSNPPQRQNGPPPHKPPPVAFEACKQKAEGDTCSVQFDNQTINGVCVESKEQELFCLPDRMPEPPQRR